MKKVNPTFHPFGHRANCAKVAAQIEQAHPKMRVISNQSVVRLIVAINHWFQTDVFAIGRALIEFDPEHLCVILTVTSDADDQQDFVLFRRVIESLDAPVCLERDESLSHTTGNACWYMNLKLNSGADIDDLAATLIEHAKSASEKSSVYVHATQVREAIEAKERMGGSFKVSMCPVNTMITAYSIQSI